MKNNKILFTVLGALVLSSCQFPFVSNSEQVQSSSSESTNTSSDVSSESSSSSVSNELDLNATLNALKEGVKVSSVVNETYNETTNTYYLQNTSKEREFSYILYNGAEKSEKLLHEYYVGLEGEENIFATRLDVSNTYNYYEVFNPSTYEYYTWNDGYNNVFLSLTSDSFTKVNDSSYQLNQDAFGSSQDGFSTLLYANPGLQLNELVLTQKDDGLYIEAKFKYESAVSYSYEVTAKVLESGTDTQMDYRTLPFEEVEDSMFDDMVNSLRANNYSLTIENYEDDILDSTLIYLSNEDKMYYESYGYKAGYFDLGDGTLQEVLNKDGTFYKNGTPIEASLDEIRPAFMISSACFDKEDNVYTLKDGVEGSIYSLCVLESYADELDELTITITDDSYQFVNICGDYKTVLTFENIGTTDVGYTSDSVLEATPAGSWEDILGEETFAYLVNLIGDEAYSIPVVPGNYGWFDASEDPDNYLLFVAAAGDSILDDTYGFIYSLMDSEYVLYEEDFGLFGGYMMLKQVEVNGEEKVIIIEVIPTEEALYIAIYDEAFYEENL